MLGALLLLVAGCGVVQGTVSTVRALDRAGFSSPQIRLDVGESVRVEVEKDTEDLNAAAIEAAGVVWSNLPLRVEGLDVTCENGFGGRGTYQADRTELEQRFGARDPDLDRGFEESDLRTVGIVVVVVLVGGLLVLTGIIILIVVLVRRSKKRNPPPAPPGPPPGWGTQPPPPDYRP